MKHARLIPKNAVNRVLFDSYQPSTRRVYGQGTGTTSLAYFIFNENGDVVERNVDLYDFSPSTVDRVWTLNDVVFVLLKDGSNNYTLQRSTDNGVTFSLSLILGEGNGPASAHATDVSILDYGICSATIGGVKSLIVGEYNVNGSRTNGLTNDRVRYLQSTNNGSAWSTIYTFNADGVSNNLLHNHSVQQDPIGGKIYFCNGDTGDHACIIEWDGTSAFPADNSDISVFAATSGFTVLRGQQRYRAVNLIFDTNWIYYAADSSTAGEAGIWRFRRGMTGHNRAAAAYAEYSGFIGWTGFKHKSGRMFISTSAQTTGNFNPVYEATDGTDWEEIGRANVIDVGVSAAAATPYSLAQINDDLVIHATRRRSGTQNSLQQTGIYDLSKDWIGQRDNLLPLAFVSPDAPAAPTNNRLGDPSAGEWINDIFTALSGGIVTFGHRVVVKPGTYTHDGIQVVPAFASFTAGVTGLSSLANPVQVTGDGSAASDVIIETVNAATADFIRIDAANHALIFEHLWIRRNTAADGDLLQTATVATNTIYRDCQMGMDTSRQRLRQDTGSTVVTMRCDIVSDGTVAQELYRPSNASAKQIIHACIIREAYRGIDQVTAGATVICTNSLFYGLVQQWTTSVPGATWYVYNNIVETSQSTAGSDFSVGNFNFNWCNTDTSTPGTWGTNSRINETTDFVDVTTDDYTLSATNPYNSILPWRIGAIAAAIPACLTIREFHYDINGDKFRNGASIGPNEQSRIARGVAGTRAVAGARAA